ncbi:MAG: hypothetical protein JO293_04005 [Candidatus Eremiobacteraeota bacterium]|nr:hypothetical protein [Candidatus Eremiobacteraeota bacterium]MBV8222497.1 hypothetical protein [Candidatus Eremiobacteraeota bacterium]MBV8280961.1 hypothetical protein [Candidatus Eremiobacteraeota bacterium]
MFPVLVFLWLAALWQPQGLLADESPSPAALPAAVAPSPAPTIKPVQWQGITLGENIESVRSRLGTPDFNRKVILGSMLVEYPIHGGEGSLVLETTEKQVTSIRVEAAAPKELSLPIGDPFGVNLGDSVTRLLTLRGEPTRMYDDGPEDQSTIYGGPADNRWIYSVHNSVVVAITLIAPKPPQPPGPPRNPGLTLTGTPPPHHGVTIHGTPAPVAVKPANASTANATAAKATATPVAATSPTPVPGIALTPNPSPGPARPTPVFATVAPVAQPTPTPAPTSAVAMAPKPAASGSAQPQPADGSSIETAIVVRAPDMATGFDYMYKFVENISCGDGSSQYRITGQDITSEHRHNYAKVTAECPTTHDRRLFYFDVTYIFTKSPDR